MTVLDTRKLPSGFSIDTDVCIVGTGAAGLTLAAALESGRRDICVLEAGGFGPDEDTQALHDVDSVGYPVRDNYMDRARYYGGTCNLWAGRAMKLARRDIEGRPWLGDAGAAWPISYAELERFYDDAGRLLRLPSDPLVNDRDGMSDDERAILECNSLVPNIAIWGRKPMRFGRAFRRLFRRDSCKLFLHANATEIVLDSSGRQVKSLLARSLDGNEIRIFARSFVLAAGGLENARLLLVSQGNHSGGVGNQNDLVGRFYMDHPRVVSGTVHLDRPVVLTTVLGTPVADGKIQLGIGLSEELQRREALVNSYVSLEPKLSNVAEERYRTSIGVMKVLLRRGHAGGRLDWSAMQLADIKDMIYLLTPKEILPHVFYRSYVAIKRQVFGKVTRGKLTIVNYCEQLPDRESRVYLSEERDRLSLHKLVLDWRVGAEVRRSIVKLHEALDEQLHRTGIGRLESTAEDADETTFTDASHHMGTTRMSDNPKSGVVDSDCRVHGVANLFVAGSSVFPSSGNANPTWAIVALVLRLAEHLEASMKRGGR